MLGTSREVDHDDDDLGDQRNSVTFSGSSIEYHNITIN
jgi:hypothetical protein